VRESQIQSHLQQSTFTKYRFPPKKKGQDTFLNPRLKYAFNTSTTQTHHEDLSHLFLGEKQSKTQYILANILPKNILVVPDPDQQDGYTYIRNGPLNQVYESVLV
jgi:hypothetical protein